MSKVDHFVIVYQFGKVASTSITSSLNKCRGVEAHQSHFLGEDALRRMVSSATDTRLNAYFHRHIVGQFMTNLELTYKMNSAVSEGAPSLTVVSLSREPMDWLRSCIQQDVEGYKDDVIAFARTNDATREADREAFTSGLKEILNEIAELIESKGGVETALKVFLDGGASALFEGTHVRGNTIVGRICFLFVRPLIWFEEHFRSCFKFGLEEFSKQSEFWLSQRDGSNFLLLRYEDLTRSLQPALASVGIEFDRALARENVSKDKAYSAEILEAFNSPQAERLKEMTLASNYARFFNYTGTAD